MSERTIPEEIAYWRAAETLDDFLQRTHNSIAWIEALEDDIRIGIDYEEYENVFDLLLAAYRDLRDELRRINTKEHQRLAKNRARNRLNAAKLRGEVVNPPHCQWEGCRETVVEAHHHDYSRPLDVEWLCNKHHAEAHTLEGVRRQKKDPPRRVGLKS